MRAVVILKQAELRIATDSKFPTSDTRSRPLPDGDMTVEQRCSQRVAIRPIFSFNGLWVRLRHELIEVYLYAARSAGPAFARR